MAEHPGGSEPTAATGAADDHAILAVTAHGLLNSTAALLGSAETLRGGWDTMDVATREQMLDAVLRQARLIAGTLQDVVRGMSPVVAAELDALGAFEG